MRKLFILTLLLVALAPQICFGQAATMYVTPAGAGNKSGSTWANAMGYGEWETDIEGSAEAGDIYYLAGGTYTADNSLSTALSGTDAAKIKIIGVKSGTTNEPPVYSDWAFGNDRPLMDWDGGIYDFSFNDHWEIRNIRLLSTDTYGLIVDDNNYIENCYIYNSSGSAFEALSLGTECIVIGCELISDNGEGIYSSYGSYLRFIANYIHDCVTGIDLSNSNGAVLNENVISSCTTGIDLTTSTLNYFENNDFYNCTTAITGVTTANSYTLTHSNIFDECTTPATWDSAEESAYFDYNSWDGDSGSNVNIYEGNNSIDVDIDLNGPGAGDFTLKSGSACLDAGLQIGTNQGITGDYKWNIGADQDDVSAGGATGGISVTMW